MRPRLEQLDGLRGIAALMVVFYHYTAHFGHLYGHPTPLPFEFSLGRYGVQLFFIISGFVIFLTLNSTRSFGDFLVSRFSRLFPAYWAAVLLTFIVVFSFSLPGREVSWGAAVLNLSMLQEWIGVEPVDGVYWTLTLELSFYGIMLALFLLDLLPIIDSIAVFWLAAMLVSYGLESYANLGLAPILKKSLLLEYANLFIAGIMFYKLHEGARTARPVLILSAAIFVEYIIHGARPALVCSFFFALFYLAIDGPPPIRNILTRTGFLYLGAISYCLYLLHQNIGYVVLRYLYAMQLPPFAVIPIVVAVSIVLAGLLSRWIERPAMKAIRTAWHARRSTSLGPDGLSQQRKKAR